MALGEFGVEGYGGVEVVVLAVGEGDKVETKREALENDGRGNEGGGDGVDGCTPVGDT